MIACKWNGRENPRIITGRHTEDCPGEPCLGCQPCEEPHCRICIVTHVDGTCAECMAETREALHDIARMTNALPEEVEHRGIDGEAMMLLGPSCDPEAWGHMEASVSVGRIPEDYLEINHGHVRSCDDPNCDGCIRELHPLWILANYDAQWREALEHDEPEGKVAIASAVDYLDKTMTYMGGYEHLDFHAFAMDLRRCRNHLEAVLHDGDQLETGAPCMTCRKPLERVWGDDEKSDGWRCPRCKQTSTDAQYRFAVMHLAREEATHLTDRDMEIRTGVKAGTVRAWARPTSLRVALVEKRREGERTVYAVADVLEAAKNRGMVAKKEDPEGVDLREQPCMP